MPISDEVQPQQKTYAVDPRYPENWPEISHRIRFERAGGKCEQCKKPHGETVWTAKGGYWKLPMTTQWYNNRGEAVEATEVAGLRMWKTAVRLQCAHLGVEYPDGRKGNKHDKMDCRDENLKALCQGCHLELDKDEHIGQNRNMLHAAKFRPDTSRSVERSKPHWHD